MTGLSPHSQPQDNPTMSVTQLNAKLAEAGDIPKLTEKQRKKAEEKQERFMNSMITRKEALQLVDQATQEQRRQLQLLFIQVQTIVKHLTDSGSITLEEIDNLSKTVIEEIYGKPPVQEESANAGDNGSGNAN